MFASSFVEEPGAAFISLRAPTQWNAIFLSTLRFAQRDKGNQNLICLCTETEQERDERLTKITLTIVPLKFEISNVKASFIFLSNKRWRGRRNERKILNYINGTTQQCYLDIIDFGGNVKISIKCY